MRKPFIDNNGIIHFNEVDSPTIDSLDLRVTALEQGGGGGSSAASDFKRLTNKGTLASGERISTDLVHISKDVTISALIEGSISSVQVGVAYQGYYGRWFEITPTEVKNYYGSSSTLQTTYQHGLTLGNRTTIIITRELGSATLILINDEGDMFKQSVTFGVNVGTPFVRNNGSSSIDAELSFFVRDLTKHIWLFGDSYFSYQDTARWTYYLVNWNYTNWLMDARGGEHAGEALADLQVLLSTGAKPRYVVWCHGMNRGADEGGSVNPNWLQATQTMLTLCSTYGITPILATIPSVPNSSHAKLNEWVKSSGYRYIDFAAAVEQEGSSSWKGWGTAKAMLSSDNVHPTSYGAKALVSACMADFPEITLMEN